MQRQATPKFFSAAGKHMRKKRDRLKNFCIDYYPYGMPMPGRSVYSNYRYGYQGEFAETDSETGMPAFELRLWDARIGRWLTTDPARQYDSPYLGMGNNPVSMTDSDGGYAEENPVYGSDGTFRGVDEFGLQGEAIIYDGEFTNGMAQSDIFANGGKLFSDLSNFERFQFMEKGWGHWKNLPSRPDWDGFVTIQEGIDWAKAHPGALANPTPDNALYVDSSQLDFGNLTSSRTDFPNVGVSEPQNLLNAGNLATSTTNPTLAATVYALGRVRMVLHSRSAGTVSIVNNRATNYDWNTGGTFLRNSLIRAERARAGLNDTHGFRTFYYGIGRLNR